MKGIEDRRQETEERSQKPEARSQEAGTEVRTGPRDHFVAHFVSHFVEKSS